MIKIKRALSAVLCICLLMLFVYIINIINSDMVLSYRLGPSLSKNKNQSSIKFAVIGDSQAFSISAIAAKAKERGCQFVVHTGDFVEIDDETHYKYFMSTLQEHNKDLPVFLTRGNHENIPNGINSASAYLKYIPEPYYQFEYFNCLFVVLDSSAWQLGKKQLIMLDNSIQSFKNKSPDSPVFIFSHVPPGYKSIDDSLPKNESRILLDYLSTNTISYLFAGHYHEYHEFQFDSSFMIINGCGGGSYDRPSPDVFYIEVEVNNKNIITHRKVVSEKESPLTVFIRFVLLCMISNYYYMILIVIILIVIREAVFLITPLFKRFLN